MHLHHLDLISEDKGLILKRISNFAERYMKIIERNNVRVIGDNKPTILYAHGFGCHQGMWDQITPSFQHSYKQILFDYVGSGQSELQAFDSERYKSLEGYRDDILEICDALDLKKDVIFVGHSVSCSIGWLASIARPELFSKQVSIGPSPCFLNKPKDSYYGGFDKQDLEELLALMAQNYMGWAEYLAPIVSGGELNKSVTGKLTDSFCTTDPTVAKVFAKATFFSDNRGDLQQVNTPNLILQHGRDALVPTEIGKYLHHALKHSALSVLDVSGHCAHMSHPDLVVKEMRPFIDAQ